MNQKINPGARSRAAFWGKIVIVLVAFLLRTSGLSHDLHLERVYHPDTPKQMRAVERFLDGNYYQIVGGRDYDGYPYFNSHLIEYLVRAYEAVGGVFVRHLGMGDQVERPGIIALYWITRTFNALLSALAVLIVMMLGNRLISQPAGLAAGLLLALSPVDVTACHFAAADTTAAFFALAATAVAARMIMSHSLINYISAGLLSAAAFSTKYHGGMALIAALVAHTLATGSWKALFSLSSIGRVALLVLSFIVGVFITSPTLLIAPEAAFKDILAFLEYTASFGMTPDMMAMSLPERIRMGMSLNMPALEEVIGWIPAALAPLGLWAGRKKGITWVIAAVPLFYILAGLSTKPLTHPVYHTMATPGIFMLAGMGFAALMAGERWAAARRVSALILLVAAAGHLAHYTRTELFFFRHNDTRYVSHMWAQDNIPASFTMDASKYTFHTELWTRDRTNAPGAAFVFSGRDPVRPPDGAAPMYTFMLEDEKLSAFRNWPQQFYVLAPGIMEPPFARPGFMPMPAVHPQNMIMADAPWLVRNPATRILRTGERRSGALACEHPLDQAVWLIAAGTNPCEVTLSLGRRSSRIRLHAGETKMIRVDNPRPEWLRRAIKHFYAWHMQVHFGSAQITLLHTPRDRAWAHFNTAQFAEARDEFERIPESHRSPGDTLALDLCRIIRDGKLDRADQPARPINLQRDYGMTREYLGQLPAMIHTGERWMTNSVPLSSAPEESPLAITTPDIPMEPGIYNVSIHTHEAVRSLTMRVLDRLGRTIESRALDAQADQAGAWRGAFTVDHVDRFARIQFLFEHPHEARLNRISIRPDHEATLHAYAGLMQVLSGDTDAITGISRLWYAPLLALGDAMISAGQTDQARDVFLLATQAAPMRREARSRIDPALAPDPASGLQPVHARFKNGAVLTHAQTTPHQLKAGEALEVTLHWRVPKLKRSIWREAIYLQGIPSGQKAAVFFGDAHLIEGLKMSAFDDSVHPPRITINIPPETPPGTYDLVAGLWVPSQKRRIQIKTADAPFSRRGVLIATIEVRP